jgi:DNA mismatch repair protein MutS2
LPSLDLHGYDRETARVAINDFIRDNIKMKNDKIIIVHGKGTGVLRKTTHETLSKNKNVEEFQIDFFNEGSTIVRVKI